jgi:hypothetical protein
MLSPRCVVQNSHKTAESRGNCHWHVCASFGSVMLCRSVLSGWESLAFIQESVHEHQAYISSLSQLVMYHVPTASYTAKAVAVTSTIPDLNHTFAIILC